MHELVRLVLTHVRMVWRFRWIGLGLAMAICLAGWVYVLSLPNVYAASTKVFLDTRTLINPVMQGLAINTGVASATSVILRTLRARPSLEEIARKTDLDLTAKTPDDFERLLNDLRRNLGVSRSGNNIFVISYRHEDPKVATRVVEAVLNIFVERSLGDTRKDTTKTFRFIDKQMEELQGRLLAADQRLKEFKQTNMGLLPGSAESVFGQLKRAQADLGRAQLELKEALLARDELARQLQSVDQMLLVAPEQAAPPHPLDGRIANLEQAVDELLIKYTERHPDVVAALGQLERLRAQRAEELAARGEEAGAPDRVRVENPMFQQLKIALGEAEARVSSLQARVGELARRAESQEQRFDRALDIEIEFKRLNEGYAVDRGTYDTLLTRRKRLEMGENVSQMTDNVSFNILDPPREPKAPASPNRPVMNAGVLFFGFAAGTGLAWLLAMLRPTIYSREDIPELADLPVLGAVSRMWTPRERFRRRLDVATFGVGCAGLLMLFGGLVAIDLYSLEVMNDLTRLTQKLQLL